MAVVTEREKNTRRTAATTRTSPPTHRYVAVPTQHPAGPQQSPIPSVERRPMGQRGARPMRMARDLSWRSPMLAAVLMASFGVSLLCFYITAYAKVNTERLQLSSMRQELKMAQRQEESLKAEISTKGLSVRQRATAMGMIQAPPDSVLVLPVDNTLPTTTNQTAPRIIEPQ